MEIRVSRFENRIKEMKMTSDGFCVRLSFYYLRDSRLRLEFVFVLQREMAKTKAIEIDKRFWLQGEDTNVYKGDLRQIKKETLKLAKPLINSIVIKWKKNITKL